MLNQIFNADETSLRWKLVPSKSLVNHGEKRAKNFKQSKDQITLLTCANAAETCKLQLAFIHKSAKPRYFKHMDMNSLPVHYYAQCKAWMDTTVFEKYGFTKSLYPMLRNFVKMRALNTKSYCC